MAETTISPFIRFKQNDGTFNAIFPISTVNDVYFDINNTIIQCLVSTGLPNVSEVKF